MAQQTSRRETLSKIKFTDSVNASLWLDKFLEDQDIEGDRDQEETYEQKKTHKQKENHKQKLIREVTEIKLPEIYQSVYERWKKALEAAGAKCRRLRIEGRMIVGLGSESVLETSITLHRIYGVPFIPGSALKGLAASYASRKLGDGWKRRKSSKSGVEAEKETFHKLVFGSQDFAGLVTFHDALLIPDSSAGGKLPLHKEIMTVHHTEYYGDTGEPPADWDTPTPIPFLSASGDYLVALSSQAGLESVVEKAFEILELALAEEGIGAKTSSGYGRAKLEKSEEEIQRERKLKEENSKVEDFQRRLNALRSNEMPGRMQSFYEEFKNSQLSEESRKRMAQAIVEKIRAARLENKMSEKNWYRDLLEYLKQN